MRSPDGGPLDSGTVAPDGGGCPQAGAVLCEDFENGLSAGIWSQSLNAGTVALDTSRAVSGTHSLHVHVPSSGDAYAYIYTTLGAPFAGHDVFGHAWVYETSPAPYNHSTYFMAAESSSGYNYGLGVQFQKPLVDVYYGSGETPGGTSTLTPTDRWACYEWEFDGATGTTHVWIDGQALSGLSLSGLPQMAFDQAWFGFRLTLTDSVSSAFDVWLDDLALGTSRVGCP